MQRAEFRDWGRTALKTSLKVSTLGQQAGDRQTEVLIIATIFPCEDLDVTSRRRDRWVGLCNDPITDQTILLKAVRLNSQPPRSLRSQRREDGGLFGGLFLLHNYQPSPKQQTNLRLSKNTIIVTIISSALQSMSPRISWSLNRESLQEFNVSVPLAAS